MVLEGTGNTHASVRAHGPHLARGGLESGWGTNLNDGYAYVRLTPWLIVAGTGALIVTTLGFTFLGEALRDMLDPKLRRSI